jgi:hypothetical protein
MRAGKKVRRKSWSISNYYYCMKECSFLHKFVIYNSEDSMIHGFDIDLILADDWEVIE